MDDAKILSIAPELYANPGRRFVGTLSPKSKHVLTLPRDERTGKAFLTLVTELGDIEFFGRFSNNVRETLARVLMLAPHPADVFLLRQGEALDPPQATYVILNGVVSVQYRPCDSNQVRKPWPEKILSKGNFFGHVDILCGRPPSTNVQTVGYSELLMLEKDNFCIIRDVMADQVSKLQHHLMTTEAVARFGWTEDEYKALEIYSDLRDYPENAEVYVGVEDGGKPPWTFFVVSGECRIAREMVYSVSEFAHKEAFPSNRKSEKSGSLREVLEFEEAKRGYYFGVGEDFSRNKVLAGSGLECLLIPRLILVFKDRQLLKAMASDLADSLPSDQDVLDNYAKLERAKFKKAEMLRELLKHKPERLMSK